MKCGIKVQKFTSSWGGIRYLPHAFTEQGIYMLMTVLRGELATRQSRALVMAFKDMKDYIVENQGLLTQHDYLRLSMQVSDTQQTVHAIQVQLVEHEDRLNTVFAQIHFIISSNKPVFPAERSLNDAGISFRIGISFRAD